MSIKAFSCALKSNPEQLGIAVSEHLVPTPDEASPGGVRFQALIAVLWNEVRTPAPSYHEPSELVWLAVPGITDDEEFDDEDFDEDEDEVEAATQEATANAGALS
jgi:hypothetical protein